MTIQYQSGLLITGTAADRTGGTWTNLAAGWKFLETDTLLQYYWNGTAWSLTPGAFPNLTLKLRNPANTFTGQILTPALTADANLQLGQNSEAMYIVYVDVNTGLYTAKNARLNDVISSTATAETAIQAAITAAGSYGTIIIRDGTFTLSGAFTGFTFLYNQKVIMGRGCNIRVPNAYTGSVFKLVDTSSNSHINFEGGLIDEVGTAAQDWTCFDLNATTTTGLTGLMITACRIVNAKKGIAIRTDTNGWVNASNFIAIYFDLCEIGVEWAHTGTYTDGQSGGNNNTFTGCTIQAAASSTHGFKDVNGRRNQFINCYTADFATSQTTCNITSNAKQTMIQGGSTCYWNFRDASTTGSYITGAFGNTAVLMPKLKKQGTFQAGSQTNTFDGLWAGTVSAAVGNAASIVRDSAGLRLRYNTSATINTLSGSRINAVLLTERSLNPITSWKLALPGGTTTVRAFIGLTSSTAAAISAAEPLPSTSGIYLGFDSAVDATNWHIYQNSGNASSNTSLSVAAVDGNAHTFVLKADNTGSKWQYSWDGAAWVDINTAIPAAATGLGWQWWIEDLAASSRTMDIYYAYTEQDG